MENVTTLTPFHEEPYGKVRSWKAYGNGILAWRDGELCAYSIDGRRSLLVPRDWEDAGFISLNCDYHPYSQGAIFYARSYQTWSGGMKIDKRIQFTAHSDQGRDVILYDSQDQYIPPPLEWAACSSGIVIVKKGEKESKGLEKSREKTLVLCSVEGDRKRLYHGAGDEWKPYGKGIILRQGNSYFACRENADSEQLKKVVELDNVEYWTGYGRGLILGRWNELWAFHDGDNSHYSQKIFQGKWKQRVEPHLPASPCFQPCLEGIVMELDKEETGQRELILCRDYAAQEVLYAGGWKGWEVYDNLLIVEQLQQEEKRTIQSWSALKIKDSTSLALAGIEEALQHREISRTGTAR